MNKKGFQTYYHLTELSFFEGIIGEKEYIERILSLRELSDSYDIYEEFYKHWKDYYNYKDWDSNISDDSKEIHKITSEIIPIDNEISYDFKIYTQGVYCGWEFHQNDADDKPSVPHGHGIGYSYKLDVYRGYIYDKNHYYVARESKKYIKNIWNDNKFRDFAILSLNYFIANNKNYNWRGIRKIKNPKKIPKK